MRALARLILAGRHRRGRAHGLRGVPDLGPGQPRRAADRRRDRRDGRRPVRRPPVTDLQGAARPRDRALPRRRRAVADRHRRQGARATARPRQPAPGPTRSRATSRRARSCPRTRAGRPSSRSARSPRSWRTADSRPRCSCPTRVTCCASCGWPSDEGIDGLWVARRGRVRSSTTSSGGSTRSSMSSAPWRLLRDRRSRRRRAGPNARRLVAETTLLALGGWPPYTVPTCRSRTARVPRQVLPAPPPVPSVAIGGSPLKQAEDAAFVDLIACERDCRTCSYAAALDCDGNCGVCPHNSYCPCVNPVVARSKTALRLIELRPILLQDLQARN